MDVESDTVAGSMTEGLTKPGFGDDRSTDVVDRLGLDARGDCGDGSSLSLGDQRKDLAGDIVRRIGTTDDKRTSHIAAIPVDERADVDDQKIAGLERPIARRACGNAALGPGATIVSYAGPDAPAARMASSSASPSCRSVVPGIRSVPCRRARRRRAPLPPRCEQAPPDP